MKSVQDLSNLKFQIQSNQNLQLLLNSSCLYCLTVLSDTSPFLDGMTASGRDHNPLLLNTRRTSGGARSMWPAAGNKLVPQLPDVSSPPSARAAEAGLLLFSP